MAEFVADLQPMLDTVDELLAAGELEAHPLEDLLGTVGLAHPPDVQAQAPGVRRLGEAEADALEPGGDLDARELLEVPYPVLHHLGLGGLGAKAPDEGFDALDLALDAVEIGGKSRCGRIFRRAFAY